MDHAQHTKIVSFIWEMIDLAHPDRNSGVDPGGLLLDVKAGDQPQPQEDRIFESIFGLAGDSLKAVASVDERRMPVFLPHIFQRFIKMFNV